MKRNLTILLLGSSALLQGCFLSESEVENVLPPNDIEDVSSLYEMANGYPIGVAVPAGDASNSILAREALQAVVSKHFNQLTAENIMKPVYLQPAEGNFQFEDADQLVAYAQGLNASVHGHTLVWHDQIPDWMKSCTDAIDCSQIMNNHITNVASHFAGKVVSWDVVNEAFNYDGSYRSAGSQGSIWHQKIGDDYLAQAFTTARAADAEADLYYNDYQIEDNGSKLDAVLAMVADFEENSVPIDGIGFQMHVGLTQPEITDIAAAFARAQATGLKVKITELDVRVNETGNYNQLTNELATSLQARYKSIVVAYLAGVPSDQRGGISVWGVSDADSWILHLYGNQDWPLLFDENLSPKLALHGFAEGLQSAQEPSPEPEPEPEAYFSDDFSEGVMWYQDGSSNVTGTFTHDSSNLWMNIDAEWAGASDNYSLARTFGDGVTIDFTTPKTLSFDIFVPSEFGSDGHLAIQPFIMDGSYTPAYTGYTFDYVLGEWATISISGISPDFGFGYNGNPDFSSIDRVGLQLIANGATLPRATVQINNVRITD